ncbi:MAG TPA: TfoX/Sxy family protein [Anaerolineales bacterium]|nr:TfoX/Sxy family protein [Anaerolineales bacterium]
MPYDMALAQRIRTHLQGQEHLTEKEMFGGIGFMINGNVACGVIGKEMMVRVGPEGHAQWLATPHVRPFDMTGRPAKGWIMVGSGGLQSEGDVRSWVERGVSFGRSLPAK